jgi:DNA-binding winged helix-turn-helix (wHTH) protein
LNKLEEKLYRIGQVEVDAGQRTVRRDGGTIQPRTRTFGVLIYLIDRRDRVVSRQELLEALWPGTKVTDNSIMQCINEVRRALGDDTRNPRFIRTVAKAGYQFIGPVEVAEGNDATPMGNSAGALPPAPVQRAQRDWPWIAVGLAAAALAGVLIAAALRSRPPALRKEAAWWKFDEGGGLRVSDSAHGMTAVLPRGLLWTPGVSGSAIEFPGSELVLRGADPGRLPRGSAERTLMAWVRTTSTNGDSSVLVQQGDPDVDSQADHFHLSLMESGVAGFGSGKLVLGSRRVDDGRWHHLAGVYDGGPQGSLHLFVDGVEDAAPAAWPAAPVETAHSEWAIGRGMRGGTSFRGALDDIRIYNRALRPAHLVSLNRCMSGPVDIAIHGRDYFYGPVHGHQVQVAADEVRNAGRDFAGITFVRRRQDCSLESLGSADVGQDFNIEVELELSATPGMVTEAGPYFRSRRANPGDGIMGGASAGFWVQLNSSGQVRVIRLHPMATIAFSQSAAGFDSGRFHKLEAAVHGQTLEVALDGRLVEFDAGGIRSAVVPIPDAWLNATPKGTNEGAAGVAFGSSRNRGQAGGQRARRIAVSPYRPLSGLP